MLWIFVSAFLLLCFFSGFWVFARSPVVGQVGSALGVARPRISLIVPARNEERNLPRLLLSLESERSDFDELIVVDDHSTDATAQLARDFGARVISADALPAGWTGKNWACHLGQQAAQSELLCFVDADVEFVSGALRRVLAEYRSSGAGALSLIPYHVVEKPYEELSSFFNLLMAMGTGAFSLRSREARLVGQFLCIDRRSYVLSGGHEAVRAKILENFSLTPRLLSQGVRCRTLFGRGVLRMRMFPEGFGQLWEGWAKAFARGSREAPGAALAASVLWTFGPMTLMSLALVPGVPSFLILGFWCLFATQIAIFFSRVGSFSKWGAVLFPLPLLFYQVLFFVSLAKQRRGSKVSWRGRSLPAQPSSSESTSE